MVIYLDQYRAAKATPAKALKNGTYGDAISTRRISACSPLDLPAESVATVQFPGKLSVADIDTLYALATQI